MHDEGDTEIDIVGFSRGAALAVHFLWKRPQGQQIRPRPPPTSKVTLTWEIKRLGER